MSRNETGHARCHFSTTNFATGKECVKPRLEVQRSIIVSEQSSDISNKISRFGLSPMIWRGTVPIRWNQPRR